MPLTLRAPTDSSLFKAHKPITPSCRRASAAQFSLSRRPAISLASGKSIVKRWRTFTKVSDEQECELVQIRDEQECELVEVWDEVVRGRVDWKVSGAAMMAGLMGLQLCLPAMAENMALASLLDLSDFQSGFSSSFLLIFLSEIGDKTFFIAALLATRKSNLAVFSGTFGALAAMTVISVTLGRAFDFLDDLLPATQLPLDDLAAVVLLVYFGVSTLLDAASMEGSKAEEEKQDAQLAIASISGGGNIGLQAAASTAAATFALVFVAEWGDKSFFSTIALSAASSPAGVVTGAIAGHGMATALAVLGGSFLSEYFSEKLIAYSGGVLFLVFAALTLASNLK